MAASAPTTAGALAPASGRRQSAALVLGIVALVTGFAVVTLLAAVVAIILASLS